MKSMTGRAWSILAIALLIPAAACGGAEGPGSPTPTAERPSDWGEGMTYDDCTEQGFTDYGVRTGQKWIGDLYADLYRCVAPTNGSTSPPTTDSTSTGAQEPVTTSTQPMTTSTHTAPTTTTTLAPLRGLRYQPVFSDVRTILNDEFAMPLQVVAGPGGQYNYMITREGRVWIVEEGTFSRPPVLDLRDSVGIGSEAGLLGMALHPDDPKRIFVNYTDLVYDLIVAEYQLDDSLRTAIPSTATVILKIPTQTDFHKGGMLQFGPDGYLYVGVGDDGYDFNGQDPTTRLGAVLRLDIDGEEPYGIPTDHPPLTQEAPEVYLYGLRNPWRFWIDPETNTIYIGDVGADSYEEIDITSLDTPGTNFGWSILEGHDWGPFKAGMRCRDNPENCDTSGFTAPALALQHSPDVCAVIGGVVYRGAAIPELAGTYFYSDACGGFLRSFRWNGTLAVDLRDWTDQVERQSPLHSFGVDTEGEMYVMTADNVFRVEPVR